MLLVCPRLASAKPAAAPSTPQGPIVNTRPTVIDDFIRNFLIKMNMHNTLDSFQVKNALSISFCVCFGAPFASRIWASLQISQIFTRIPLLTRFQPWFPFSTFVSISHVLNHCHLSSLHMLSTPSLCPFFLLFCFPFSLLRALSLLPNAWTYVLYRSVNHVFCWFVCVSPSMFALASLSLSLPFVPPLSHQTEWYELQQKGLLKPEDAGTMPDVYLRNEGLEEQVKALKQETERLKEIDQRWG